MRRAAGTKWSLIAPLAVCLAACAAPSGKGNAPVIVAELDFSQSTAQCANVHTNLDGRAGPSTPAIARTADRVAVAITHAVGMTERIELVSTGYRSIDCTGLVTATSSSVAASLVPNATTVPTVRLLLKDHVMPDAGQPDAGLCVPSGAEVCGNGKDDDCDGRADCADSDCLGQSCTDQSACTQNERCLEGNDGGLCGGDPVTCNSNECLVATGACMPQTGCMGTPRSGRCAADAGVCDQGECEYDFPFVPSNGLGNLRFKTTPSLNAAQFNCGVTIYDSTFDTFTNWCGAPDTKPKAMTLAQAGATNLRVLPVRGLSVAAASTLRIVGEQPVAFAVFGDADIQGHISVDADGSTAGAGYLAGVCDTNMGTGTPGPGSSSTGGGGGAYGRAGGQGGDNADHNEAGGPGGKAFGASIPSPLHGGCAGGAGHGVMVAGSGGAEGAGGGALQLTVTGFLKVGGSISANGAGGQGGRTTEAGGGGGGSGGALLLEASRISISLGAHVVAHGGAGGSGSESTGTGNATPGEAGENGHVTDGLPAQGGALLSTNGVSGNGGNGDARDNPAKNGSEGNKSSGRRGGGGGGGGGAGRIYLRASSCSVGVSTVYPPSSNAGGC